jgi:hypothetical protein
MGAKGGGAPAAVQPQALRNLKVQESAWGQVIPIRYGEQRCAFNLLCAFRFQSDSVSDSSANVAPKKGGGFQPVRTFVYYVDAIGGLGEGLEFGDTTSQLAIGRAVPGRQVTAVDDGISRDAEGMGQAGTPRPQPSTGVVPGVWRGKRVRIVSPTGPVKINGFRWRAMHWASFGGTPAYHIARDGDLGQALFTGQAKTVYITSFNENYPGIAFVGIQKWHLGASASLPQMNFPPRLLKQYNDWYGLGADSFVIYDCDPAMVLEDLLTNAKHGAGWHRPVDPLADTPGLVPVGSVRDFTRFLDGWPNPWGSGLAAGALTGPSKADSWSAFCRATDVLLSPGYDAQRPMAEILTELAEITNTAPLWSEGKLKMIPRSDLVAVSTRTGATYTPSTDPVGYTTGACIASRADLTVDDFLPVKGKEPIEIERQSVVPDHGSAGMFNDVPTEFEDRDNAYANTLASPPAKDEASIAAYGVLSHETLSYHAIKTPEIAADVAHRALQQFGTARNLYRFKLGWEHCLKEPMDVLRLTYEPLGLDLQPVRVTSITEEKQGGRSFEAEEYPEAFPAGPPHVLPPEDILSEDVGGVFTAMMGVPDNGANPIYLDMRASAYFASTGSNFNSLPPSARPYPCYTVFPQSFRLTALVAELENMDLGGPANPLTLGGFLRVRVMIEDVSRQELELSFATDELGVVKIATVQGELLCGAGQRICWEFAYVDGSGNVLDFTDDDLVSRLALLSVTATARWEPA